MIDVDKIYNESCLVTMSKMSDEMIDLAVTSPPYNMRLRVRDGEYTTREKSDHFSNKYKYFDDNLSIDEYFDFHSKVIDELLRVSKIVVYNIGIVTGSKEAVFQLIGKYSKNIKDLIIWDKGHGEPAMHENVINRATELIFIIERDATAGRAIKNSYFERGKLDDIWRSKRGKSEPGHSAVMPDYIAGLAIKSFSPESGLIYDPFGGSGTTAINAIKYGRNWILSETSKEYCDLANRKIEPYITQFKMF